MQASRRTNPHTTTRCTVRVGEGKAPSRDDTGAAPQQHACRNDTQQCSAVGIARHTPHTAHGRRRDAAKRVAGNQRRRDISNAARLHAPPESLKTRAKKRECARDGAVQQADRSQPLNDVLGKALGHLERKTRVAGRMHKPDWDAHGRRERRDRRQCARRRRYPSSGQPRQRRRLHPTQKYVYFLAKALTPPPELFKL